MPWVNVVRALVPLSLCDLAAALLIKACGGEEVMKRTLGGTKWWQVRDTQGCVRLPLFPDVSTSRIYTIVALKPSG